ncbi:hypothetical protein K438DRAFT_712361 [Mycena galopus ATCC 62051]|nr:hypothetical protein K438DRAFT_712361 [Mycena galopus ATCC 62051]
MLPSLQRDVSATCLLLLLLQKLLINFFPFRQYVFLGLTILISCQGAHHSSHPHNSAASSLSVCKYVYTCFPFIPPQDQNISHCMKALNHKFPNIVCEPVLGMHPHFDGISGGIN